MATWGDQTCQRFEATAVGFETGFSRLKVLRKTCTRETKKGWYYGQDKGYG